MHIADQQERVGCEPRVGGHIKVVFLPDCAMLCRVKPTMLASGCSRAGGRTRTAEGRRVGGSRALVIVYERTGRY